MSQDHRARHQVRALKAKRSSVTEDGEPTGSFVILAPELQAWLNGLADA